MATSRTRAGAGGGTTATSWTTTIPVGLGRAIPSGVYDLAYNDGYVVIGTTHDTPDFAVATIRRWWLDVGRHRYPEAKRLLIEVDGGGANDHRKWGWKAGCNGWPMSSG